MVVSKGLALRSTQFFALADSLVVLEVQCHVSQTTATSDGVKQPQPSDLT